MMYAVFAQSQETVLNQYFEEAKSGSYATAPQSLFDAENDFNALLNELENYHSDSTQRIRLKAYDFSRRFGQIAKDQSAKQLAIDQQIKALQDEDRVSTYNAYDKVEEVEILKQMKEKITNALEE